MFTALFGRERIAGLEKELSERNDEIERLQRVIAACETEKRQALEALECVCKLVNVARRGKELLFTFQRCGDQFIATSYATHETNIKALKEWAKLP